MPEPSPRERFRAITRQPESRIDLAEAALWIAAEDSPPVPVDSYLRRLDQIAEVVGPVVSAARSDVERIAELHRALFVEQGFTGNRDDYYDPRNSWLHEVIDRRVGIPITLALVYIAVAVRLGFDVRGISFPGHFLVKHVGESPVLVDPFFGCVIEQRDCAERLAEVAGPEAVFRPEIHLRDATRREILVRLLSNLEHIWLQAGAYERALSACDRILLLIPDAPDALRDRGLLYERMECHAAALADFERCLVVAPNDPHAPAVAERVIALRAGARRLH